MQNEETVLNLGEIAREQKINAKREKRNSKVRAEQKARARKIRILKIKLASTTLVLVSMFVGTYWFTTNYYLRNPVLLSFQSLWAKREPQRVMVPVVMGEEVTTGVANAVTKEEKIAVIRGSKYPVVIAGVWNLESTSGENANGHHNYCNEVGYSNEFGFGVYGENRKCFRTFDESVSAVEAWFDGQLKRLSVDQALCLYNTGSVTDECDYAYNYRASVDDIWSDLIK